MSAPERIQKVARALAEAIEHGEQGRVVRLPVVQPADAAGIINVMHGQLDEAIAHRDAQIGDRLACGKGCNACCESPVLVSEGEAIAVAEWLREPAHADARAQFEVGYARWKAGLGELVAQAEGQGTDAWMASVQERQVLCAFNHDGGCSIYPVRPGLCRKTHALDTSENCRSQSVPVQYYQHPETEALYEHQRRLRFALHKALRPKARLELLCTAVHRLLAAAAPGRNDPCSCGSEKKYKKCCGA